MEGPEYPLPSVACSTCFLRSGRTTCPQIEGGVLPHQSWIKGMLQDNLMKVFLSCGSFSQITLACIKFAKPNQRQTKKQKTNKKTGTRTEGTTQIDIF